MCIRDGCSSCVFFLFRFIEIYVLKVKTGGAFAYRNPATFSRRELANGVRGLRLVARIGVTDGQIITEFEIGVGRHRSRRRRDILSTGGKFCQNVRKG